MPKKKNKIVLASLSLFIIAFCSYCYTYYDQRSAPVCVRVTRGTIVRKVLATGTVNALVTVPVGCQSSGIVKEIYVDYNSLVRKGQVLAVVATEGLEAQVSQAKANLEVAKALLAKTEVKLNEAGLNLNRIKDLYEKGYIARSELDAAEALYDSTLAERRAQEAQIVQNDAALKVSMINLDYASIRSPVDGVVLTRNIDVGQTISASLQIPTVFQVTRDLRSMEVVANVSEADIGEIKIGQDVSFTVEAYPQKVFSGKVKEVRLSPTVDQKVVTYSVVTSIGNKGLLLRPGMTADVTIKTATKENVLLLPAVVVRETAETRSVEAWDGTAVTKKAVKTGLKGTDGSVEIIQGVAEGEEIIIPRN